MLDDDLHARIVTFLAEVVPDVQAVYLFGSHADGRARPDSDLDVALLAPRPLQSIDRWTLQEDLARHLNVEQVDLVDLRTASTVMQAEVLRSGEVLAEPDPTARAFFETYVMSAYALLNEERAGILEDVAVRGHVHAKPHPQLRQDADG